MRRPTFFLCFDSKEDLAVAAVKQLSFITSEFFKSAPHHRYKNPLERTLGYIEFRKEILRGKTSEFICLVGTLLQETCSSTLEIRKVCKECIFEHAENLETNIKKARQLCVPRAKWSVKDLAFNSSFVQGSFVLAKAVDGSEAASRSIDHLKNYILLIFNK